MEKLLVNLKMTNTETNYKEGYVCISHAGSSSKQVFTCGSLAAKLDESVTG
jgi:hypothetical protein